jgi:hypothetical protein
MLTARYADIFCLLIGIPIYQYTNIDVKALAVRA